MDRLEHFIKFEFSNTWFTSQELRERYETVADDIKLSTVSTYLSRMNRVVCWKKGETETTGSID